MAFDYFNNDEEQNGAPQGQSGQQLGQDSPVVTGAQSKNAAGGTSSGQFTNLQSYLDANKSLNFGSQVAGKVGQQVQGAQEAQDAAQNKFNGDVDKNTIGQNSSLLGRVNTDPESLVSNQQDNADFMKMRDAKYQGPQHLVDTDYYQPAYQKSQDALAYTNATKDEGGRKAFLQQEYGSGKGRYDYGSGMQKLDNLLIQNDPNSRQAFQDLQGRAQNVAGSNWNNLKSTLDQYAGQGAQTTAATRGATRSALGINDAGNYNNGGAIGSRLSGIDAAVAARLQELQQNKNTLEPIAGYRNVNQMTAQQKQMLGVNPASIPGFNLAPGNMGSYDPYYQGLRESGGDFHRINPATYLSYAPTADINRGSVSTASQQAKVAALSKLAGLQNTFITNPQDVGKYTSAPLYKYDPNAMYGAVGAQRNALQSSLGNINNRMNQVGGDPSFYLAEMNRQRNAYGIDSANPSLENGPNKAGNNPAGILARGQAAPWVPPAAQYDDPRYNPAGGGVGYN